MSIALRPLGLGRARPLAAVVITLAHVAVLGFAVPDGRAPGELKPITVSLERVENLSEQAAGAPPEEVAPPEPTPPEVAMAEPEPLPVESLPVHPKEEAEVIVPPNKVEPPKKVRPKPIRKRRENVKQDEEPRARREAKRRETPRVTGSAEGRAATSPVRASQAGAGGNDPGYASHVRAVLQSRANALGFEDVNASVSLSFVIGASGQVSSSSLSRPSGDARVDGALRRMIASCVFLPPPGERFSGTVTVRIH